MFAEQITTFSQVKDGERIARRFKKIGHPASEGFEQHYNDAEGHYLGRIETVNNFGLSYRSYPAKAETGRLFNNASDAVAWLLSVADEVATATAQQQASDQYHE